MKKIFGIILIIVAFAVSSCGSVSKVTNDPYSSEGSGIAFTKDNAYNKAYLQACSKIAQKYNFVIDYSTNDKYESEDFSKGKGNEYLLNIQETKGRSHVDFSDIVVDDKSIKYRRVERNKFECTLAVKVDPNNIKFYGTGFALFNVNEKEDLGKALSLAEKDAMEYAKKTGILDLANQQSETLIKGILANAIPNGYTMEVKN